MIDENGNFVVTINDIRSLYRKGGVFGHKYEILITPPQNIFGSEFTKKLRILAKSATIPKKEIKTKTISYKGRPVVLRSQLDFGETCSVSVYEDSEMNIRKTLDKWITLSDSLEDGTIEDYHLGSLVIYQLDNENNRIYGVEFKEVFLTSISEIKYSAERTDNITYDLTFAYSTWENIKV